MNLPNAALFLLTATLLLGSPGPGIAALLAVGRARGFLGGLRFFGGLQAGLAVAAAISAAGLVSIIRTAPIAATALTLAATAYLLWLAWRMATAPVGVAASGRPEIVPVGARDGFLLGITNPKAYLAFAALMGSWALVRSDPTVDAQLKWLIIMLVIVVVDILWLGLGGAIGRVKLGARGERALNIAMGGAILAAALVALF